MTVPAFMARPSPADVHRAPIRQTRPIGTDAGCPIPGLHECTGARAKPHRQPCPGAHLKFCFWATVLINCNRRSLGCTTYCMASFSTQSSVM